MAKEYPQLKLGHHLIDSAAMLMVKDPRALNGIVVTSNLFGDIISDEASVIPGSLGLLPSASLSGVPNGKGKCNGIYEPIHGTYQWRQGRSGLTDSDDRLRTRYRRPGEGQPSGSHSVNGNDVIILVQSTRGGKGY